MSGFKREKERERIRIREIVGRSEWDAKVKWRPGLKIPQTKPIKPC